jgi:hypothetical protein
VHRHITKEPTILVEEGIEDTWLSLPVDTNTIPKLKLKLLPRHSKASTVNNLEDMANSPVDMVNNKDRENGRLNNHLPHTINQGNNRGTTPISPEITT